MPNPAPASFGRPPRALRLLVFLLAAPIGFLDPVFGEEQPEAGKAARSGPTAPAISFGEREARHLLNRAGFGGTRKQVASLAGMGLDKAVETVLRGKLEGTLAPESGDGTAVLRFRDHRPSIPGFANVPIRDQKEMLKTFLARNEKKRLTHVGGKACWAGRKDDEAIPMSSGEPAPRERSGIDDLANALPERCPRCVLDTYDAVLAYRTNNRAQVESFRGWWIQEMIRTPRPLKEKMALFWHNYFPSSWRKGIPAEHMGLQIELFRRLGLGNFRALIQAVAKDRAMLRYLDTLENRKRHPNENFARELMELFTLGVGHYTEKDVLEAARAFTGWAYGNDGFFIRRHQHDDGVKVVLGKKGSFGGEQIIDLLLDHPATASRLAARLLEFFAGPDRPEAMDRRYAALLVEKGWDLTPFLETLFTDPDFYLPAVVGSRILGPVESIAGIGRRLEYIPPNTFVGTAAEMLGQALLEPPSVKGWEGGEAWITTSLYFWRCRIAGYLVEGVTASPEKTEKTATPAADPGDSPGILRQAPQALTKKQARALNLTREPFAPPRSLRQLLGNAALKSPESVVDGLCKLLLATEVTSASRSSLVELARSKKSDRPISDDLLIRLARIIVSLPEAQMS